MILYLAAAAVVSALALFAAVRAPLHKERSILLSTGLGLLVCASLGTAAELQQLWTLPVAGLGMYLLLKTISAERRAN